MMPLTATPPPLKLPLLGRESPFRIAVVGGGPRGMFALDSLTERLAKLPDNRSVVVTIFEPADYPGAGPVYDPNQPHFLRMNYASCNVSAWRAGTEDGKQRLSLVDWLKIRYPEMGEPSGFVPRAIVGEYLIDCVAIILSELSQIVAIDIEPSAVREIERSGGNEWRLTTDSKTFLADEVLVTTGHQGWIDPKTNTHNLTASTVIDRVFPVNQQLDSRNVPAGSTVAICGFALTSIDAILALTEGRGGTFSVKSGRLGYSKCGAEPQTIFPFSRTGRPLLSKPEKDPVQPPAHASEVWQEYSEAIRRLPRRDEGLDFLSMIWPQIVAAADRVLDRRTSGPWFDHWCAERFDWKQAYRALLDSYLVATGERPPEESWALAEAWRNMYPALVDRISHGGLAQSAWSGFRNVATEMERIAFGPPATNVARLLALIDEGIVDLCHVSSGESIQADILIQATIPPPQQLDPRGPLDSLLRRRHIARDPRSGGLRIDRNGYAASGLAILGRATEGWVLGNDTLNRDLHSETTNWASTIANRMTSRI